MTSNGIELNTFIQAVTAALQNNNVTPSTNVRGGRGGPGRTGGRGGNNEQEQVQSIGQNTKYCFSGGVNRHYNGS